MLLLKNAILKKSPTLSPWMFSKDKYFYLGREKKERAPLDGLSYSYLVAKLSDDGKVQYLSVP